ncbi:MAG: DedA family protein [Thermomicrobiales bacterium]|nr:DedA family protein [Thermomicrobiales bacterium]
MLSGLQDQIIRIVDTFGYPGITGLILAETVFPPIPSELILPLAGFLAGQGHLTLIGVMLAATIGSVIGALLLYGLGLWFGQERLYAFIGRFGRFFLLKPTDLDRANGWFERHGSKAVTIGRVIPVVRSLISLPAGVTRMPLVPFIIYTAIGSAIWNGMLVGSGWILGNQWERVAGVVEYFQYAVILVVLVAVTWFAWSRRNEWRVWWVRK